MLRHFFIRLELVCDSHSSADQQNFLLDRVEVLHVAEFPFVLNLSRFLNRISLLLALNIEKKVHVRKVIEIGPALYDENTCIFIASYFITVVMTTQD